MVTNGAGAALAEIAPKQRRLVLQLWHYWEEKRGGRRYPSLDDIDPKDIAGIWPHCFILDVTSFQNFPYFHYLGPRVARYSGVFLTGRHDWSRTLLKKMVCHYKEALERREPVMLEDELTQFNNRRLLFRSVMLPLSDDQVAINFLLGAANGAIRRD